MWGQLDHAGACIGDPLNQMASFQACQRFAQWLETRELRPPVIIWVIKNRDSKKYAEIVAPLIVPSFLGSILASIDTEALESNSTARIPLANELIKDKALIADIIALGRPAPIVASALSSSTVFGR